MLSQPYKVDKKVLVLMATFNGEKWINEQINSIAIQKGVNIDLVISDDYSNDKTIEFIDKIKSKNKFNSLKCTKNEAIFFPDLKRNHSLNFYRLILDVDLKDNFSYVAFSDQDDVWMTDKLERAINFIEKKNFEVYSSSVIAFKGSVESRNYSLIKKGARSISKLNHIFEAPGPGCTFVLSKKAFIEVQKIIKNKKDKIAPILFHDWLLYYLIRTKGLEWYIDGRPTMYYRQHASNVHGASNNISAGINRIKNLVSGSYLKQVRLLISINPGIYKNIEKSIDRFNLFDRISLAFISSRNRRRTLDKLLFFVLLLISKAPK